MTISSSEWAIPGTRTMILHCESTLTSWSEDGDIGVFREYLVDGEPVSEGEFLLAQGINLGTWSGLPSHYLLVGVQR